MFAYPCTIAANILHYQSAVDPSIFNDAYFPCNNYSIWLKRILGLFFGIQNNQKKNVLLSELCLMNALFCPEILSWLIY